MKTNYNSNLYLTPNDLNTIENKIEEVTNKIKMFVFSGSQSSLTHIQTNDKLGGKTLYLSFPRDIYENITSGTEIDILKTNKNNKISYIYQNSIHSLYIIYNNIKIFCFLFFYLFSYFPHHADKDASYNLHILF